MNMINNVITELKHRSITALICILCTILLVSQYTNELIIYILYPMKSTHTDWHMYLLFSVINSAFDICDIEVPINRNTLEQSTFDYIPVIEVNMNVSNINSAIITILLNITIAVVFIQLMYQIYLIRTPGLYKNEQKVYISSNMNNIYSGIMAIIMTQYIWTFMYFNVSLHNYNELNFYEFDVDMDINDYISKYIWSYYIHFALISITNNRFAWIILLYMIVIGILSNFEIVYFTILLLIVYSKRKVWRNIIVNKRMIISLKEYCIVRKNWNNE